MLRRDGSQGSSKAFHHPIFEDTPKGKIKKVGNSVVHLNSSMTVRSGAIKEVAELSRSAVAPKSLFKVSVDEMVRSNKKTND